MKTIVRDNMKRRFIPLNDLAGNTRVLIDLNSISMIERIDETKFRIVVNGHDHIFQQEDKTNCDKLFDGLCQLLLQTE